jgi:uncharacterized protein YhdP
MAAAFGEIRRVLKPKAWLTLVFHNSSGKVWAAIQEALTKAGLPVASIHTFDKAHDTFKMVTAPNAVGYDVVVNCRKIEASAAICRRKPATIEDAREFVRERLALAPDEDLTARRLHAEVIGHFMRQNRPINFDFSEFRPMADTERRGLAK